MLSCFSMLSSQTFVKTFITVNCWQIREITINQPQQKLSRSRLASSHVRKEKGSRHVLAQMMFH